MSREEALRSYTLNNAIAAFEESVKGSLAVGKLADVTVLSADILTVPDDEIGKAKVVYTIVGGKVRYRSATAQTRRAGLLQPVPERRVLEPERLLEAGLRAGEPSFPTSQRDGGRILKIEDAPVLESIDLNGRSTVNRLSPDIRHATHERNSIWSPGLRRTNAIVQPSGETVEDAAFSSRIRVGSPPSTGIFQRTLRHPSPEADTDFIAATR
jgi:hypothetical protein